MACSAKCPNNPNCGSNGNISNVAKAPVAASPSAVPPWAIPLLIVLGVLILFTVGVIIYYFFFWKKGPVRIGEGDREQSMSLKGDQKYNRL